MKEKITALYKMLSRDDEQQGESNSIINQKNIWRTSQRLRGSVISVILRTMGIPEPTLTALASTPCWMRSMPGTWLSSV